MDKELKFNIGNKFIDLGLMLKKEYDLGKKEIKVAFEDNMLPDRILLNDMENFDNKPIRLGDIVLAVIDYVGLPKGKLTTASINFDKSWQPYSECLVYEPISSLEPISQRDKNYN